MTAAIDIVGVGTNSVDDVFLLPAALAAIAETGKARTTAHHRFCGGQTATAVCACARLGLRSRYVGVFGSDAEGSLVRRALDDCGVDTSASIAARGPNRRAVILVDPDGRRTVVWNRSDAAVLSAEHVGGALAGARVLHVDDDDPALALTAARAATAAGMLVTTDLEHIGPAMEELIRAVTHPIFEQRAPCALTGETDLEPALRKLRRLTPNLLCVTLGDGGAAALEGDRFHVSPAFAVDVADSTGAGDVFRAGFIYGLLQGWEVARLLRFANAAAAVSCTRLGAMPSVPSLDEVQRLLDQAK